MEAAFLALAMWAQQGYLPGYTTGQITCGVYALDGDIWYSEPKELQGTANGKRFVILGRGGNESGIAGDTTLRWTGESLGPSTRTWGLPGRPVNPVDGDIWYGDDGKPLYGRINGKWVRLKPSRKPRVQPQK